MQNGADLSSLIRVLQYAIGEAEHLGVTEIAWAKDLSGGDIVIEIGGSKYRSFFQINASDDVEINNIHPILAVVGGKDSD